MTKKNIIILAAALVVLMGASFYGGMKYSGPSSASLANGVRMGAGSFTGGSRFVRNGSGVFIGNGGVVAGEIVSIDENGVTVKLRDGGSKVVFFSGATTVTKQAEGTRADLAEGVSVIVEGTANQDGSITANSVQIRPAPVSR